MKATLIAIAIILSLNVNGQKVTQTAMRSYVVAPSENTRIGFYHDGKDSSILIEGDTTKALWVFADIARMQKELRMLKEKPSFTIPNAATPNLPPKESYKL